MARSPAHSISAGGTLLASVSSKAIAIWTTDSLSPRPLAVLPAPESQAIISAALAPCGALLAVLFGNGASNPVLLLCHPESAAPIFRLELPRASGNADCALTWVPGPLVHSLLIHLEEANFCLLEFCPGYHRIESKKLFDVNCKFGSPLRIFPVKCGKVEQALVLMYANAIAVFSLPNGEPLILKDGLSVKVVMQIIRTSAGYAALGLIDNYSARMAISPERASRPRHTAPQSISPTGVQDVDPGLVWAVIGNNGCKALAPLTNFRAERVLTYSISNAEKLRLVLLTDAARVLFLDPYFGGGPLFEYRLPRTCVHGLEHATIVTACASAQPLQAYVVLAHRARDQDPGSSKLPICLHVIGNIPDEAFSLGDSGAEVTWPIEPYSAPVSVSNCHPISHVATKPSTSPSHVKTSNPSPLSILLKLRLGQIRNTRKGRPSSAPDVDPHAFEKLSHELSLTPRRTTPRRTTHSQYQSLTERSVLTQSVPLRLAIRMPKPLCNITNLGVDVAISRPHRRRQNFCMSEGWEKPGKRNRPSPSQIPLRLRISSRQRRPLKGKGN